MIDENPQVDVAEVVEPEQEFWGNESNVESEPPVGLDAFDDALVPNNAPDPELPENAGEDQSRYQYWQSRYDQKASEFETANQKLADYDRIAPIAEYIQENPNVLKQVAKSLSGDEPSVPSQEKSQELPKKPTRPTKPTNYDATEAYMDTESDSFKYRVSLDDYRDGMIDFQDQQEQVRINQLRDQEAMIVQRQQEYERTQAMDGMKSELVNRYGYESGKADEFMKFYSSPESVTLDNLVHLDKLRNSPSQAEVATRQKAERMTNQSKRLEVPAPAGIQSGQAEPQFSDEDLFNLGLMANRK